MAFALPMVQGNTKSPFEVTSALQRQKNTKKKKKEKPQSAAQKLFDPVEVAKQLGRNQETVLQTPEAKQRFKDSQDPFKNGFFKKPTDQSASKTFNREQAKNDVQVAQGEQTNAQKLFAPAVPDIQTDKAGNKLASKNGMPVGYSGNPTGAGSPTRGKMSNPNTPVMGADGKPQYLGMTDAERAANRENIQNVAANFEPTDIIGREMYRRQQAGEGNKFPLPKTASLPQVPPTMLKGDKPVASNPQPAQETPPQPTSSGFNLPNLGGLLDPLGLAQSKAPEPPAPYVNPQLSGARPEVTPDYILKALNGGVDPPPPPPVNSPPPTPPPPLPNYVDDFSNVTPTAQPQPQQPFDANFWSQFLGVPTALPTARVAPHQGRSNPPARETSPFGQRAMSPETKAVMVADQNNLVMPPRKRNQNLFVNQF